MIITVDRAATFAARDVAELATLAAAVRGPEESLTWPGRSLEWTSPDWYVRARDSTGRLVSVVGIVVREGTYDGLPVRIGGIGGVKTHPDARRQGWASQALRHAAEFFLTQPDVAFALLVCDHEILGYYAHRGWSEFRGTLMIRNRQATAAFTIASVMTRPVNTAEPRAGTIDLCGPPW